MIHVWTPGCTLGTGGIQTFSWSLIRSLLEQFPDAQVSVFSLHDINAPDFASEGRPGSLTFHSAGNWSFRFRTMRFTQQVFAAAVVQRPDLILSTHVNFTPVARWLKRLFGIRYAAVAHGIDVWDLTCRRTIQGMAGADAIFAVSRYTRQRMLAELPLKPEHIKILPNTVDADVFRPGPKPKALLKRFGLRQDQPVLLTITRLAGVERYKGYETVLRLLPSLRKLIPGLHYVLGGKGSDRSRIEAMIEDSGVSDMVTMAGFVSDEELNDFYNLADIFVMPSRREGFGIVFLEALACGKPVIAGNEDGSVDPLWDGEFGVLINPCDPAALAAAIVGILDGSWPLPLLWQPWVLREKVLEKFGQAAFGRTLAGLIKGLLP